jgi:DNA-binding Lrp family transcriptional regulator
MEKEKKILEPLKVDRTKLYTQVEYAKKIGLSEARVSQKVKAKEIKTISINGGTLIYED